MPIIELLKRAENELFEACDWYEKQQNGLASRFIKEFNEAINHLSLYPKVYAIKYNSDHRFIQLKKFPYILVYWYDENQDKVFITSVFHTKRNPKNFEK